MQKKIKNVAIKYPINWDNIRQWGTIGKSTMYCKSCLKSSSGWWWDLKNVDHDKHILRKL